MSETKNNCRLFTANGLRFDGCGSAREADYIHTARRRAKDGTARKCATNILQIFGFGNGGVRASKLGLCLQLPAGGYLCKSSVLAPKSA